MALLPEHHTTPDAKKTPQDLSSYLYIDLSLKLDTPAVRIVFRASIYRDDHFMLKLTSLFN